MAIDQSSVSWTSEVTMASTASVPSSLPRPEIPFGQLIQHVSDRIEEYRLQIGEPKYVVMGPEMWERFRQERVWDWDTVAVMIEGVMAMVILDFGDEVICGY